MSVTVVSDVECSQAVLRRRAYGEDSGTVSVKFVNQIQDNLCWAACMASVVNYFKETAYEAMEMADYLQIDYGQIGFKGLKPDSGVYYYKNWHRINCELVFDELSYGFVYDQAYNKRPIEAQLSAPNADRGHAVLVRGCYISNSVVYDRLMDPWYDYRVVQMKSDGTFSISMDGKTYTQKTYIEFK